MASSPSKKKEDGSPESFSGSPESLGSTEDGDVPLGELLGQSEAPPTNGEAVDPEGIRGIGQAPIDSSSTQVNPERQVSPDQLSGIPEQEGSPIATGYKSAWNAFGYQLPSGMAATAALGVGSVKDFTRVGEAMNKRVFDTMNRDKSYSQDAKAKVRKFLTQLNRMRTAAAEGNISGDELQDFVDNNKKHIKFLSDEGFLDQMPADKITEIQTDLLKWAQDRQDQGAELTKDLVNNLDKIYDPLDAINWASYAFGQAVGQILPAVASFGATSIGQEVGSIYLESINRIAEKEGISAVEVIDRNLDGPGIALTYGVTAGLMERMGAANVMKNIGKEAFTKSMRGRAVGIFNSGKVEYITEGAQTILEQLGQNEITGDTEIDWREVKEAAAQGFVGGSGLTSVGQGAQAAVEKITQPRKKKAPPAEEAETPIPEPDEGATPTDEVETPVEEVKPEKPVESTEDLEQADFEAEASGYLDGTYTGSDNSPSSIDGIEFKGKGVVISLTDMTSGEKSTLTFRTADEFYNEVDEGMFNTKKKLDTTPDIKPEEPVKPPVTEEVKEEEGETPPVTPEETPETPITPPKEEVKQPKGATKAIDVPVGNINTDEDRFQNRTTLDENVLQNISENFDLNQFDPVVIWKDPKDGKDYLLAGHHRLEGGKRKGLKNIPSRYFEGTEAEAITYAKELSNANRTLEKPSERAGIYRKMREDKTSKAEIKRKADQLEGKNAQRVIDYSYLNPKGETMQALNQFENASETESGDRVKSIAQWVGNARSYLPDLTDSHENELFKYLLNSTPGQKIVNKIQFRDLVDRRINNISFDSTQPLNLEHAVSTGPAEQQLNKQMAELVGERRKLTNEKAGTTSAEAIRRINQQLTELEIKEKDLKGKLGDAKKADEDQTDLFGTPSEEKVDSPPTPNIYVGDDGKIKLKGDLPPGQLPFKYQDKLLFRSNDGKNYEVTFLKYSVEDDTAVVLGQLQDGGVEEQIEVDISQLSPAPPKKTQTEQVKEVVAEEPKSIQEVAEATGIVEPNIRRILGQGTKKGVFERVDKGVYVLKTEDGKEAAWIEAGEAQEVLPRMVKEGRKFDMIFLDPAYFSRGLANSENSNRNTIPYDFINAQEFKKVSDAVVDLAREDDSHIYLMLSGAPSTRKDMQNYLYMMDDSGLKVVGEGSYTKLDKSGNPALNIRGAEAAPERLFLFSKSGQAREGEVPTQLKFRYVRPNIRDSYPTEKPKELLRALIEQSTFEGEQILDPFAGSGVSGEQAIESGRKPTLVEKDPDVVEDVIKPRLEGETPLTKLPDAPNKGYRVASGFTQNKGVTAADVVRFERDELGNDIAVSEEVIKSLEGIPSNRVIWVTRTRYEAQGRYYEGNADEISLPKGSKIIEDIGEDGILVLLPQTEEVNPETPAPQKINHDLIKEGIGPDHFTEEQLNTRIEQTITNPVTKKTSKKPILVKDAVKTIKERYEKFTKIADCLKKS